ncbi:acyl-CoA dehydrogenase family protein [Arthrobacter sp. W4I7]|uniref:acyl-CoA dehydrogenase family protein n=1 Tax=Arthrobacter sp. W4I7 TaxID=3042296 RepID=UPI00278B6EF4|nr:acyl-CoA dehydrogenase family protein [Arthrobacter sp. W4I7]MDQ0691375.1 acyl-CoA dehydrogenase [Arthrobacter sp. W4I7]
MKRTIFEPEHEDFRKTARTFFEREAVPNVERWEAAGHGDREAWLAAGEAGLLGWEAPEEFGGLGIRDLRFNMIMAEEYYGTGATGLGFPLQNDIIIPYLVGLATPEQQARWLPDLVSGTKISALAISESGAGSDVKNIKTRARLDGDHYVVNGSKTFISNGLLADFVLVAVKTDPDAGHRGISLLVLESDMAGFSRGRKLDKIGQRSLDTTELIFEDVRVPRENLLGEENRGFYLMMRNLAQERLSIAYTAVAQAKRALDLTRAYAADRHAFGQPIGTFQVNRHALAEMVTELGIAEHYVDGCVMAANAGTLSDTEAAGAKWWTTELQWRVVDRCLQMFGGYGYINEYEIARLWRDARVQRLYGGTNEVMKDLIGRSLES